MKTYPYTKILALSEDERNQHLADIKTKSQAWTAQKREQFSKIKKGDLVWIQFEHGELSEPACVTEMARKDGAFAVEFLFTGPDEMGINTNWFRPEDGLVRKLTHKEKRIFKADMRWRLRQAQTALTYLENIVGAANLTCLS